MHSGLTIRYALHESKAMRKAYTFRSTPAMDQCFDANMISWNLDRTSIIKLGLYMFAIQAERCKKDNMNLHELVQVIEQQAPPNFPDYGSFAD